MGAGADATGGRGGAVCHVVSRENTLRGEESAPGLHEGTLRYCLGLDERRTIVFDVSGNFDLGRQSVPLESSFEDEGIYIANGDFTLAGQTAPQGGVTISANQFYIGPGARNIIIRYIRFRGGQSSFNGDGITFAEDHGAVVLDHCSFSFSKDENLDIGRDAQATVSHGLFGPGKTGALVGSSNRIMNAGSYTFVQNLFANITHRFPKVGGPSDVYVGNNFIHNWMFRIVRMDPFDYRLNFVDNYLQKGVNTRLASPPNSNLNKSWVRPFDGFDTPSPRIYADGNALPDSPPAGFPEDQSLLFQEFQHDDSPPLPANWFVESLIPHPGVGIVRMSAEEVRSTVPQDAGAIYSLNADGSILVFRDSLDASLVSQASENSDAAIPAEAEWVLPTLPENARPADFDTDRDGMPDTWEENNGFNPAENDAAGDADGDGYSNLEEYLNAVDAL